MNNMRALNFCTLTLFFNEGFNFFLTLLLVRNICVLFIMRAATSVK